MCRQEFAIRAVRRHGKAVQGRSRLQRVVYLASDPQMLLDGADIGAIFLDPKSRDDIPQILRGLQHIYTEPGLRERVFAILREVIPERVNGQGKADAGTGRSSPIASASWA